MSKYSVILDDLDIFDVNLDSGLESRNVLKDKALKLNRQKIFIGNQNAMEPLLVFSLEKSTDMSLELFRKLKTKTDTNLDVNRVKIFYVPKYTRLRVGSKVINQNNVDLYRNVQAKKAEYKITNLTNIEDNVRNESGVVDLSMDIAAVKEAVFDKNGRFLEVFRERLLEHIKDYVLKFDNYTNKAIYLRGPFLKNTGISTSVTNANMVKNFNMALLFVEWIYNDLDGFKRWCRENNTSIIFESSVGTLVLGRTEMSQNLMNFTTKYILKALHMLDGSVEFNEDINVDDEIVEDAARREERDKGFMKANQDTHTASSMTDQSGTDIIKSSDMFADEEGASTSIDEDSHDKEADYNKQTSLTNDTEDNIDIEDTETQDDIIDDEADFTADNPLPHLSDKNDYMTVLKNQNLNDGEKAATLMEIHNYTDLKKSVESEEVAAMRRAMNKFYGYDLDEVVDLMKTHVIQDKKFNLKYGKSDYGQSKFDNLEKAYKEMLSDKDIENIFTHTSNLTYPIFLSSIETKDASDREFYGTTKTVELMTHNGTPLKLQIDIPGVLENGQVFIGGSKKNITHQDAPLPVIKTDDVVQISTGYNKCFLSIKGKFTGMKMKRFVKIVNDFINYGGEIDKLVRVKTTQELGDFIYNNYVSYQLIHLNKHFAGLRNETIDIDFRGLSQEKLPYTVLGGKYDSSKDYTILGTIGSEKVYHDPEKDTIIFERRSYDTISFISNVIKSTNPSKWQAVANNKKLTMSGVNTVYAKLMGRDIPVIYILMVAKPLTDILEILRKAYGLEYKIINNDNPICSKLRDDYGYGTIKLADVTIVLKYNNTVNEILLSPLVMSDFSKYDAINITNIMTNLLGNANTQLYIENFIEFFIDPITARICKYYDIPSDFVGLFIYAASLFTTHKTTYSSDSSNYRLITTQELINRCVYDVIAKELSDCSARVKRGSRAKISIPKDAVIARLQKLPNISEANNLSPHRYFAMSRSKSYKGHYGKNIDDAYTPTTRMFNKNNLGTETGGTAYSANAGVTKYLPFNPTVTDLSGRYRSGIDPRELNDSNLFSFVESFVPYLYHDSPHRIVMTNAQFSHILGVKEADPMLVSMGADEAAIYMTPDFSYISKGKGKIVSVNKRFIKIQYDDGFIDVVQLYSVDRNADKGYYIGNAFVPVKEFNVGDIVNEGDIIAAHKDFYKKKSDGTYGLAIGPITQCLVCDSDGVWEDSTLVSNTLSNKLATKIIKRVSKVISLNSEIRDYITDIGMEVKPSDILFRYKNLSDDTALADFFGGMQDELALKEVDAHYRGEIVDINISYRGGVMQDMSPSVKEFLNAVKDQQRVVQHMKDLDNVTDSFKKNTYSSMPINLTRGKFSKVGGDTIHNGEMLIEYFISIEDKLGPADKMVVSRALKQEPTQVLDDKDMPVGVFSGRKVDMIFDTYSCLARQTEGMMLEGGLNSILLHIAIKNRYILGIPPEKGSLLDYKSSYDMVEGVLKFD